MFYTFQKTTRKDFVSPTKNMINVEETDMSLTQILILHNVDMYKTCCGTSLIEKIAHQLKINYSLSA